MSSDRHDAASALLRLGLAAASPEVRGLVERLECEDGHAWFASACASLPFRVEPPDALGVAPVLERQLQERWLACREGVRDGGDRVLLGTLGMVLCDADALLEHGRPCSSGDSAETANTLLDVAEALPDAWSDRLARAALRAGSKPLGGDAPSSQQAQTIRDHVGGYRLLEPLGRGGMGVVWRAEQAETQRHVALKLIRPGLLTSRSIERFQREGKLLARLRHPAIAQVLEARVEARAPEDPPFLAIELVDGEPLVAWAAQRELPIDARLDLFTQVCAAVHHAHEQGVVHRDLKAGNVLVTPEGRVKVLDFGIAMAIDGAEVPGEVMGTLTAMSPEQVLGRKTGPATDVYALGCLLFELLAERPAHLVDSLSLDLAVRRICEQSPPALRRIAPHLPRDLEIIAGMALEREPARRYPTARALADDVERFRRLEPIVARPPAVLYRARRALQRHRGAAVAVGIVVLALALGLAIAAAGWRRARSAERDLTALTRAALELSRTLVESVHPTAEVRTRLGSLEAALTPSLEHRTDEPALAEAAAALFEQVADLEHRRGDVETALDYRRRVLELSQRLARVRPDDRIAAARVSIALVKLGDAHGVSGGRARQRELYGRALAADRALEAVHPTDVTLRDNLIWSLLRVGHQHFLASELERADALFAEAALRADALIADDKDRVLSYFARCQARLHRIELLQTVAAGCPEHVRWAERARAEAWNLEQGEPDRAAFRSIRRVADGALAAALVAAGRAGEARANMELALREAASAAREDEARAETHAQLARLRGVMANLEAELGDVAAAQEHAKAMIDAAERAWQLDPDHPMWRRRLIEALTVAARLIHERGDQVASRAFGLRALDLCEQLEGSRNERILLARLLVTPYVAERRSPERATTLLEEAFAERKDLRVLEAMVEVYRAVGREGEASGFERRAEEIAAAWRARFR